MAKFRNPRDYHGNGILSFKNPQEIDWLELQEISRQNRLNKQKKQKQHIHKNWDIDLWD